MSLRGHPSSYDQNMSAAIALQRLLLFDSELPWPDGGTHVFVCALDLFLICPSRMRLSAKTMWWSHWLACLTLGVTILAGPHRSVPLAFRHLTGPHRSVGIQTLFPRSLDVTGPVEVPEVQLPHAPAMGRSARPSTSSPNRPLTSATPLTRDRCALASAVRTAGGLGARPMSLRSNPHDTQHAASAIAPEFAPATPLWSC